MFSAQPAPFSHRGQQFAGAYHQMGVQTTVATASAHGLIAMLFDGFFAALARARGAIRSGDLAGKGQAIGHAVRIIDEGLKASLNLQEGGKLANDLNDLYAYVTLRLTQANLRGDEAALDECAALIGPLRDAWTEIRDQVSANDRG